MTGLGLSIGSACYTVSCCTEQNSEENAARALTRPAPLLLHSDGTVTFSDSAAPAQGHEPARPIVLSDLCERVGDAVRIATPDGVTDAAMVAATAVQMLRAEFGGDTTASAVVAVPADWSEYARATFAEALRTVCEPAPALVTESDALIAFTHREYGAADGASLVIDIGARYTDVTISQRTPETGSELPATHFRTADVSGEWFDYALLTHVLPQVHSEAEIAELADQTAPRRLVESALDLRNAARIARETLSFRTTAQVLSERGGNAQDIRVVRNEFEELITPACRRLAEFTRQALRTAQISESDVARIVLAGGVAATPLITELLTREFRLPVLTPRDPGLAVAIGAAHVAASGSFESPSSAPRPLASSARPQQLAASQRRRPVPPMLPTIERAASRRNVGRAAAVAGAAAAVVLIAAGSLSVGTSFFPMTSSAGSVQEAAEAETGAAQHSGDSPSALISAAPSQPPAAASSILGTAPRTAAPSAPLPRHPGVSSAGQRPSTDPSLPATAPTSDSSQAPASSPPPTVGDGSGPSTPAPSPAPNSPQPSAPDSPAPQPSAPGPTTNPPPPVQSPSTNTPPPTTTAPQPFVPPQLPSPGNVVGPVTSGVTESVGGVTDTVGGTVGGVTGGLGQTAGNLVQGTTGAVGGVTDTVGGAVGGVTNTLGAPTSTVSGVTGTVGQVAGTAGAVTDPVTGTVSGVTGTVGDATGGLTSGAGGLLGSPLNTVGGVLGGVTSR